MRRGKTKSIISLLLIFTIMLSNSHIYSAVVRVSAAEQYGFESDTPDPAGIPAYYTETTVSGRIVFMFYGRDNEAYYRIYGKAGEDIGFYACNQYGEEIDQTEPVDLDDEYIQLAPYVLVGEVVSDALPNEDYSQDPALTAALGYPVYTYPDQDGGSQYRIYGYIDNVQDLVAAYGWYRADASGRVDFEDGPVADIIIDSNNLWVKGFVEVTAPETVPDFYQGPVTGDRPETIYQRTAIWSFGDRFGNTRYRVYGSVNGGEPGFYECDVNGNVGEPMTRIKPEEDDELKIPTIGPGGTLIPGEAYIKALEVIKIQDGTGPFDSNSLPGNDQFDDNKIVRSFDQITYTLEYVAAVKPGSQYTSFDEGDLYIRAVLPVSKDKAVFDLADSKVSSWLVDASIEDQGDIQILTGKYHIEKDEHGNPGISSMSKQLVLVVNVMAAVQGEQIVPTFTVWLDGNDENPANEQYGGRQTEAEPVTVSSAAKYNIQLERNTYLDYLETFDPDTGSLADDTSVNTIYGRMTGYSVTLQVYNDYASKGFKGIELPSGPITFDLVLKLEKVTDDPANPVDVTSVMTPRLWDYKENNSQYEKGKNGRQMRWFGSSNTSTFPSAPMSYEAIRPSGADSRVAVYKSGKYIADEDAGASHIIHVTVDNYGIDLDNLKKTRHNYAEAVFSADRYGESQGIGCFSVGFFKF